MLIHAVVGHYPSPFKSYYDAQFVDLMRAGHDVRIFSLGRQDNVLNEKVVSHGLDRRTSTYPETMRDLLRSLPASLARLPSRPGGMLRAARAAFRTPAGSKRRIVAAGRALAVSAAAPDLWLVHGARPAAHFRWLGRAFPSSAVAIYYHGGEVPSVAALDDRILAAAFQSADAVFTNTRFSREHALNRGAPEDRTHIVPVGFDLEDFPAQGQREYRPGGVLRLLSAGRMSEEKGFKYALEAVRRLVAEGRTRFHYTLTGSGYAREELERYVAAHGLEPWVTFLGTVSTEELQRRMAATDVLLLPSIQVGNWVENQACAVQEAMLRRGLVVVSRTGGVPECVAPAFQRWIAPERDADGVARGIADILDLPDAELRRLGEEGRRFVVEGFDLRRTNEQILRTTLESFRSIRSRGADHRTVAAARAASDPDR
jgi:glycosyltransferase involved in cell wall biosynthesis